MSLRTHHMEAWTIELSYVLSFDRIDFAKIGLGQSGETQLQQVESDHFGKTMESSFWNWCKGE